MANCSKIAGLGTGWSMLVVVGLMLVEPSARSLPVGIALLAIILGGWLVAGSLFRKQIRGWAAG
jgi:hypothetical protein